MRIQKLVSAATAAGMTLSAMLGTGAFFAKAADPTLTFDFQSNGKNAVTVSAEEVAENDVTVPVSIYIPENPGVCGINLKLQINDGEIAEDGTFGNYGFTLSNAAFASPYCFDSANKGDSKGAMTANFIKDKMNLIWVYSDKVSNADASEQAKTTAWDSTAEWAYSVPFAQADLVIPKGTPNGEYTLDICTGEYVNALSQGQVKSKSACTSADQDTALSFKSKALTVTVGASEESGEKWVDDYAIDTDEHYIIIADMVAKPGETVDVPVYVYNDPGTAGMQIYFQYDNKALTLSKMTEPEENYAYMASPEMNPDYMPAVYTFGGGTTETAEDGTVLVYLNFTVPETTADGTYDISIVKPDDAELKVINLDGEKMDVKFISGSITVISDDSVKLNHTSVSGEVGSYENLTLCNAEGDVTWSSSDETVATVDKNGCVKIVGEGSATITATNGGQEYTCSVGMLLGDVDANGEVGVVDAQLVLLSYVEEMVSGKPTLTDAQAAVADVNKDGVVGVDDAQYILTYYVEAMVSGTANWDDIISK